MVAAPSDFGVSDSHRVCFGWPPVGIFDVRDRANLVAAVHRAGRLWAAVHDR